MMMTPMSRSRRNRSDEERCCRDDCKSKLSHVTFLQNSRAKERLSSVSIFTCRTAARQLFKLEAVGASSSLATAGDEVGLASHVADMKCFGTAAIAFGYPRER
jgi:hypothetical protein